MQAPLCGILVFASEAEGSGPLHCGLSVRGGGLGQGGAVQQTDHRSDLGGDVPTVWYGARPSCIRIEAPKVDFAWEKCVGGCHVGSHRQTERCRWTPFVTQSFSWLSHLDIL